jgi:hypothetical protein
MRNIEISLFGLPYGISPTATSRHKLWLGVANIPRPLGCEEHPSSTEIVREHCATLCCAENKIKRDVVRTSTPDKLTMCPLRGIPLARSGGREAGGGRGGGATVVGRIRRYHHNIIIVVIIAHRTASSQVRPLAIAAAPPEVPWDTTAL